MIIDSPSQDSLNPVEHFLADRTFFKDTSSDDLVIGTLHLLPVGLAGLADRLGATLFRDVPPTRIELIADQIPARIVRNPGSAF